MDPLVSVIIPVYNAETTLERCVESLVYGKFRNIEIILVEDCSSKDNSWACCCKLASKYKNVRVVRNSSNQGVSYSRNQGLMAASGKYVLFVDSDDWVSGRYIQDLLKVGKANPDALILSGFLFIDHINNVRCPYVFSHSDYLSLLEKKELFRLMRCVHLQTVWNKLFQTDIIRKNHISFNESLNMGEDFQFVLDYLEKGCIDQVVVINQPLYYYVRYHRQSLMANFAISGFDNAAERIRRLGSITGNQLEMQNQIQQLKQNYSYNIVKDHDLSYQQKLERLQSIWGMREGKKEYWGKQIQCCREKTLHMCAQLAAIPGRAAAKLSRLYMENLILSLRKRFNKRSFTIISQNCIGGVFYHDMGLRFDSPTINLFFEAKDFLRFVLHLQQYVRLPLEMYWGEEYPLGKLGDLTIHFMHYRSCTDAFENWNRRIGRIQWDKILVLSTDRDHFGAEEYALWKQVPYPKLLFTAKKEFCEDSLFFPQYAPQGHVADIIPKREFYRNGTLIALANDLVDEGSEK